MIGANCSPCNCCPNFLKWLLDNINSDNVRFEVTLEHLSRDQNELLGSFSENLTAQQQQLRDRLSEPGYAEQRLEGTFEIERPASVGEYFTRWAKQITVGSMVYDLELFVAGFPPPGFDQLNIGDGATAWEGLYFSVTTPASAQSWRRASTRLGFHDECRPTFFRPGERTPQTVPVLEDIMPSQTTIENFFYRLMPTTELVQPGVEHSPIRFRLERDGVTAWDVSSDAILQPAQFSFGRLISFRVPNIYTRGSLFNTCRGNVGRTYYGGGGSAMRASVSADITNPAATITFDGSFTTPARRWRWNQSLLVSSMKLLSDDSELDVMMRVLEPQWTASGLPRLVLDGGSKSNVNSITTISSQTYCDVLQSQE